MTAGQGFFQIILIVRSVIHIPHSRSVKARNRQRERDRRRLEMQALRRLILDQAHRDRECCETIALHDYYTPKLGLLYVEGGEVIIDSRGEGSFQRLK